MLDVARQTVCYSNTVIDQIGQRVTGSMPFFKALALTVGGKVDCSLPAMTSLSCQCHTSIVALAGEFTALMPPT